MMHYYFCIFALDNQQKRPEFFYFSEKIFHKKNLDGIFEFQIFLSICKNAETTVIHPEKAHHEWSFIWFDASVFLRKKTS